MVAAQHAHLHLVPLDVEPESEADDAGAWPSGSQPMAVEMEDAVHVRLANDGLWHRRLAGSLSTETACGKSADSRTGECSATRHENYRGPLCPYCFTAREFAISNEITQED